VTTLARVVVLVVVALLVEAAAAHGIFAVPRFRTRAMNGRALGTATGGPVKFSRVRNIRLALEDANLLLVGLLALHARSPELATSSVRAAMCDILVDAAADADIVLAVAFDRVLAESIFEIVG
jgi:hypothetical protein